MTKSLAAYRSESLSVDTCRSRARLDGKRRILRDLLDLQATTLPTHALPRAADRILLDLQARNAMSGGGRRRSIPGRA